MKPDYNLDKSNKQINVNHNRNLKEQTGGQLPEDECYFQMKGMCDYYDEKCRENNEPVFRRKIRSIR